MLKIRKRNGSEEDLVPDKIYSAMKKAYQEVYAFDDNAHNLLVTLTSKVLADIRDLGVESVPIYDIQASVERWLLAELPRVAESYIRYRIQQDLHRSYPDKSIKVQVSIDIFEDNE